MQCLVAAFIFIFCIGASASSKADYLVLKKQAGRYLFHSKKFGSFFSVGSNSFMESAANFKMKEAFEKQPLSAIYEAQFESYLEFGFNSLGGWSNTEYLRGRLPYSIILFDDEEYPRSSPFIDCKGNSLPSGDADPLPNPLNDPFDPSYVSALKQYLKVKVLPHAKDQSVMLYWVGHEFGIGGSDFIDLTKFTYSPGIKKEFAAWLKTKYRTVQDLQTAWKTTPKNFESTVQECPQLESDIEGKDRKEFMTHVLRRWFELVVGEIRKNDPNHLISTPKLSIWDHQPQLDLPENNGHFDSMKDIFDLISVDWYTANPEFSEQSLAQIQKVAQKLNLPILVAEFGTRQKIDGWTNSPGAKTLLKSQEERGERYRSQLTQLLNNKNFIGAHWFRWQDHVTKTNQMNKGIVQVNNGKIEPYEPLKKAMSQIHREISKNVSEK